MKKVLVAVVTLSVLAGSGYAIARFTIAQEELSEDITDTGSLLLTTTRDHLSVCADEGDGGGVSSEQLDLVRQTLADAFSSLSEVPSEYADWSLTSGCPLPSVRLGEPASETALEGSQVEEPNANRTLVYLLDPLVYATTFDQEPYVVTTQEFICTDDECTSVTSAVYLPATSQADLVETALLDGLGLLAPELDAATDWSACEEGAEYVGEFECSDFWEGIQKLNDACETGDIEIAPESHESDLPYTCQKVNELRDSPFNPFNNPE